MQVFAWLIGIVVVVLTWWTWRQAETGHGEIELIAISILLALQLFLLGHNGAAVMAFYVGVTAVLVDGFKMRWIMTGALLGYGSLYTMDPLQELDQSPIYAWLFGVLAREDLVGSRRRGGAVLALLSTLIWLLFAWEHGFFSFALPMAVIAGLAAVTLSGVVFSGKRPDRLQQLFY